MKISNVATFSFLIKVFLKQTVAKNKRHLWYKKNGSDNFTSISY